MTSAGLVQQGQILGIYATRVRAPAHEMFSQRRSETVLRLFDLARQRALKDAN